MKKLPDNAEIVKKIITELERGPLRKDSSKAQASAAIEESIERIVQLREAFREKPKSEIGAELEYRNWHSRSGPHAASIRKAAKIIRKALAAYSDGLSIELEDKDPLRFFRKGSYRREMKLWEFRSALDFFEHKDGPPQSTEHLAAEFAHMLVRNFSQKPPSTTFNGQVRLIGTLLYQAVSGKEEVELKRQTDAVLRSARKHTCIIVSGGFEGNEPLQATIDGHTIFREPGEDELGFMHRAIEAARAARALPVIISEGPF